MSGLLVPAAILAAFIGIAHLKRLWSAGDPGSRFVLFAPACCVGLSLILFCQELGLVLGNIVGICVLGIAGIITSAASADLQPPKLLARSAPRPARLRRDFGTRCRKGWRLILAGPIAIFGGLSLGLVALSTGPGADADRLVLCTLVTIIAAMALVSWASSDPKLWRATFVGGAVLTVGGSAATFLVGVP